MSFCFWNVIEDEIFLCSVEILLKMDENKKKYEETERYKLGSRNWWMRKQRKGESNCKIFISVI